MNNSPPRPARSTARRKPSTARKGFHPGIHSDLNPSGQAVHPQPTPQPHYHPQPSQYHPPPQPQPQYHLQPPPQPQYHPPQLQYDPQPPPQPQYHPQPPPQPQYHADRNEDRAVAEAYAATFTLLRGGSSSRLPPQSDSIQDGPLAPWGAARLVALAPLHPGETIRGERTQGVIRVSHPPHPPSAPVTEYPPDTQTQKHLFDTGRRRCNARLPPTPEIPVAVVPNPPAVPIADPPISRHIKLSTTSMRKYKEAAKEHLRSLILNADPETDRAPEDELRNKLIDTTLQIARTKISQEEIEDIKGINHYMVTSLADMRRSFKSYALNTVPVGYHLRLPLFSEEDQLAHTRDQIKILLEDSEYLHEIEQTIDGTEIKRPLENKVLINMVIDLLKGGLSDVIHGPLDRLFAVCGATIRCVLQAYQTGQFVDVSVNSTAFDDAYHEIIAYITTTIRASHTLRESYHVVASSVVVVYDWALTSGQEFELIWSQRWSFITVLYLSALPGNTTLWNQHPVESLISLDERWRVSKIVQLDWMPVVTILILGVVMIIRLHAMYRGSRKILLFLVIIFLALTIATGVLLVIVESYTRWEEFVLCGTYQCMGHSLEGDIPPLLIGTDWEFVTGFAWEVLALCLAVWIVIKHFRDLQRQSTGWTVRDCFGVLIKTHVLYFAAFVVMSCLSFGNLSPNMSNFSSAGVEVYSGVGQIVTIVQLFVLGPRLILSVRAYNAQVLADSDEGTAMTTIAFHERTHGSSGGDV
ncbi:hypothetical protein DEU56DRAFT_917067 [Suillus clintonianus]|uniref:uncharacterized protein n=1 Tax=Suillus clintonianus TaxID=1904413 RepID=UPI001B87E6B5|nr:uncharacterized protein DEU56DRAFT_917067 [Suillus clintonianus]KAG2124379.1 hypothetical protein DEU56DRAFT_917067 [Suillus clintonianus]